jgi:hypothetical protein
MSLIHTCELNGANPFDYLAELQRLRRGTEATSFGVDALEPGTWNYRETLARPATPAAAR